MDDKLTLDPEMNSEQKKIAESLSPSIVSRIDGVLLSHAWPSGRKVAMLIGLTMMDDLLRVSGLPDLYYAQRVKALVKQGRLLAEGDLSDMKYSEVRLP